MVFKKGHKPAKKSAAKKQPASADTSDFFVKFGIKNEMKSNLSVLYYLVSQLIKDLSKMNGLRQKKALLRMDLFETMVSLRLNIDLMERHLPSKEFEALKKKIEEISKYAKKEEKKAESQKPKILPSEKIKEKKEPIKDEPEMPKKEDSLYEKASDSEKKELDKLRKELEDISNQLKGN